MLSSTLWLILVCISKVSNDNGVSAWTPLLSSSPSSSTTRISTLRRRWMEGKEVMSSNPFCCGVPCCCFKKKSGGNCHGLILHFRQKRTGSTELLGVSKDQEERIILSPGNNYKEDDDVDDVQVESHIPKGGISINDQMFEASKEEYVSNLIPITSGPAGGSYALIETSTKFDEDNNNNSHDDEMIRGFSSGMEPLRYLIALDPPQQQQQESSTQQQQEFAMVDIPPYSDELVQQMKQYINAAAPHHGGGTLSYILVTSRTGIHYDEAPAVYSYRKSHLTKWIQAFPNLRAVVSYRLDTPRDCLLDHVTHTLDGYGPWALNQDYSSITNNNIKNNSNNKNISAPFVETGRPLTRQEWDQETQVRVLAQGQIPPDDDDDQDDNNDNDDDDDLYSPEAIRNREIGKRILAIYTPGHTYGSVSYIFPNIGICSSGFTIPIEDGRISSSSSTTTATTAMGDDDDDDYSEMALGPTMDYRGYITTNVAGMKRQMESARHLVKTYADRFHTILPSRGDALVLGDKNVNDRIQFLMDVLDQYQTVGEIYDQLGITTSSSSPSSPKQPKQTRH